MTNSQPPCCDKDKNKKITSKHSLDELFPIYAKALGHPVRVQIMKFLKKKKSCICGTIVNELPLAQATVSQHLKVLKDTGFIQGTVSGPSICYCINPDTVNLFKKMVAKF